MNIRINNRGFSMIGSLLGFSLLGLSTVGLANYMGSFEKVRVTYSQQSNVSFLHRGLLEAARNVLVSASTEVKSDGTIDSDTLNKFGICGVVRKALPDGNAPTSGYSKIKSSVICHVEVSGSDVNDANSEAYGDDRWEHFMESSGNWELLPDGSNCGDSNGFGESFAATQLAKCLKHKKENSSAYARVEIKPQMLPDFDEFSSSSDSQPVDYLVYKITTEISSLRSSGDPSGSQHSVTKDEKLVWAFEVSGCHVCDGQTGVNEKCKLVRLSSIGLNTSVPGDSSKVCYHSHVSPVKIDKALEVNYVAKNTIRKSTIITEQQEDGTTARVLKPMGYRNVALSCNNNLFRCVRDREKFNEKYFDPYMSLTFSLDFIQPSDSNIDSMDLSITDGSTTFNPNHIFIGADQETRVGRGISSTGAVDPSPKIYGANDEWILRGGGNEFTALISSKDYKDRGPSDSSMCQRICENNVSIQGDMESDYYPMLEIKYNNLSDGNASDTDDQKKFISSNNPSHQHESNGRHYSEALFNAKVGCNVCHSKACHSHGRGVRSSLYGSHHEPKDGLIPECIVRAGVPRNLSSITITPIEGVRDDVNDLKRCVQTAGQTGDYVVDINGRAHKNVKLKAVDCEASGTGATYTTGGEKAACFFQGGTRVMKSKAKGINARRSCEQMVKERQLIDEVNEDGVYVRGILPLLANAYSKSISEIEDFLDGTDSNGITLPVVSRNGKNYYEFNNAADLGMFMGHWRTKYFGTWDSLDTPAGKEDTWVNIQKDAAGMFHSGWHRVQKKQNEWAFFYREPFQTIAYHDAQTIASGSSNPKCSSPCPSSVPEAAQTEFLKRNRPSRPIYLRMKDSNDPTTGYSMDHGRGSAEIDFGNTVAGNQALLLYHNIKYKGLRLVPAATANSYPYLCRNILGGNYKNSFKITRSKGNVWSEGHAKCRELGSSYFFVPPDSIEAWSAALQAVAPNAPRYPFPNPFKFIDGIPFYYDDTSDSNIKYVNWKLSYNYSDMPANNYNMSETTDDNVVFKETALASPAAAWVGVKPIDATKKSHVGKSWEWTGDNSHVFQFSDYWNPGPSVFRSDTVIVTPEGVDPEVPRDFSKLDDLSDLTNIGALTMQGNFMVKKSLRGNYNMSHIAWRAVKLCKVSRTVEELELHNAIIARGKHDDWPKDDECSDTTKGLETNLTGSIHYGLPSDFSGALTKLDGESLTKARNGIKNILTFLLLRNATQDFDNKGVHVQNAAKFCKMWKREKYRRALGRDLISKWNSGSFTFKDSSTEHGLEKARDARKDAGICHKNAEACGGAVGYYQSVLNRAVADLTAFNNADLFNTIDNRITALENKRDETCPAGSGQPRRAADITRFNNAIAALRTEKTRLTQTKNDLVARKDALTNLVNDPAALKTECVNAVTASNVDKHEQSFKPSALSSYSTAHYRYKYNFNRSSDSRCWGIQKLHPEAEYDFDGETGSIGLLGRDYASSMSGSNFSTQDAPSCYTDISKLGRINSTCNGYYEDLINIGDDDLCDDDVDISGYEVIVGQTGSTPSDPRLSPTTLVNTAWQDANETGEQCRSICTSWSCTFARNRAPACWNECDIPEENRPKRWGGVGGTVPGICVPKTYGECVYPSRGSYPRQGRRSVESCGQPPQATALSCPDQTAPEPEDDENQDEEGGGNPLDIDFHDHMGEDPIDQG